MGQPATVATQAAVPAPSPFDASTEPIIVQEISLPTSPPPPPPPPPADVTENTAVQCPQQPPKRKRGRPRKAVVANADPTTTGSEPSVKRQKREADLTPPPDQPTPVDGSEEQPKGLLARRGVVTLPKIIIPPSTTQSPFPLTVKLVIMR
ncbi:hypothetical protein AAVH_11473 [Aphelenchoides avenae]|nr:hypothetical protein AAVH_11473 [Aphelenchus avenae]